MKSCETAIISGGLLIQQATVFATSVLIARNLGPIAFRTLGTLKSVSGVLLIVTPLGPRIALFYKCRDMAGIVAELRAYLRRATLLGGYLFGGIAVFGTTWT